MQVTVTATAKSYHQGDRNFNSQSHDYGGSIKHTSQITNGLTVLLWHGDVPVEVVACGGRKLEASTTVSSMICLRWLNVLAVSWGNRADMLKLLPSRAWNKLGLHSCCRCSVLGSSGGSWDRTLCRDCKSRKSKHINNHTVSIPLRHLRVIMWQLGQDLMQRLQYTTNYTVSMPLYRLGVIR